MTKPATDRDGRAIEDAAIPIDFKITADHVRKARCGLPNKCVIALAMRARHGFAFEQIQVGASITKIYMEKRILRFTTPKILRDALITFDTTGEWSLPTGTYTLNPITPSLRIGRTRSKRATARKNASRKGSQTSAKPVTAPKTRNRVATPPTRIVPVARPIRKPQKELA